MTSTIRPPFKFSLLCYNILAPCYVRIPNQPWNAFAHCRSAHLDASTRLSKIQRFLATCNASIICLQEVVYERRPNEWKLPEWTDPLIERGYVGVMQALPQKDLDKNAARNQIKVGHAMPTGLALFYQSSIWEESEPGRHGGGSGSVVFLRSRDDSRIQLAVGNTHLVGDPAKFDLHLNQLNGLMKSISSKPTYRPIICGDFNHDCPKGSPVGNWIAEHGFVDDDFNGPTWAEPGTAARLDHILYRPSEFGAVADLDVAPRLSAADMASGLPNEDHPSDHIPVAVSFTPLIVQ